MCKNIIWCAKCYIYDFKSKIKSNCIVCVCVYVTFLKVPSLLIFTRILFLEQNMYQFLCTKFATVICCRVTLTYFFNNFISCCFEVIRFCTLQIFYTFTCFILPFFLPKISDIAPTDGFTP